MKKDLKSFVGLHVSVNLQAVCDSHYDVIEYKITIRRKQSNHQEVIEVHYYYDKQMAFLAFSEFVKPLLY